MIVMTVDHGRTMVLRDPEPVPQFVQPAERRPNNYEKPQEDPGDVFTDWRTQGGVYTLSMESLPNQLYNL
ncbi:hypothetical protein Y1Q_0005492 [Alligator mississippiensis]|uniref:Uncharacterized protein n=1 Tax=Alligator mississippiensis TaxID=8496 RepID=A0A151MF44_ALLMI|nr:hypothetical protein Y1Q_0005492 [Alligator mississippiensis]